MNKVILPILLSIIALSSFSSAFAQLDFSYSNSTISLTSYPTTTVYVDNSPKVCGDKICGTSTHDDRELLFDQIIQFNQNHISTTNNNYLFALIETPTGISFTNIVLSADNMTALRNNVAIFTACGSFDHGLCQPPVVTSDSPNANYCPIAKTILLNQGDYLNQTYNVVNGTIKKDFTHFVYPDYCLKETGQNPYSPIITPSPVPIPINNNTNSTPTPVPIPTPSPVNSTNSTPTPIPQPVKSTSYVEYIIGGIAFTIVIAVIIFAIRNKK